MGGQPTGNESKKIESKEKIESIDPHCIVKFRPHDNWKGEYGFDWFRIGDTDEGHTMDNSTNIDYTLTYKAVSTDGKIEVNYIDGYVGKYVSIYPKDVDNPKDKNVKFYKEDHDPNDPHFFSDWHKTLYKHNGKNYIDELWLEYDRKFIQPSDVTINDLLKSVIDSPGNPYLYSVPVLSLYYKSVNSHSFILPNEMKKDINHIHDFCTTSAKIKLLIRVKDVDRIVFECDDKECNDKNCISVNPTSISPQNEIQTTDEDDSSYRKIEKEVTITLNYDFNEKEKSIKAYAFDKNNNKTLAGMLTVLRCVPRTVDVCFVNVKCTLPNQRTDVTGLSDAELEKKRLIRFLSQAQIIPNITVKELGQGYNPETEDYKEYNLDLRKLWRRHQDRDVLCGIQDIIEVKIQRWNPSTRKEEFTFDVNTYKLSEVLEKSFNNAYPTLSRYYKIFFLGTDYGIDYTIGEWDTIQGVPKSEFTSEQYSGRAANTPSKSCIVFNNHPETTACHELLHCFGLVHSFSNENKHTFAKDETYNIMDYSNTRYNLWRWQWEKMWKADGVKKITIKKKK